jgi:hypothetical protein
LWAPFVLLPPGRFLFPLGVLDFFLAFSSLGAVVGGTSAVGGLSAMILSAAEWATQILPACVAGMGEKANAAMDAVGNALPEGRMVPQNRVECVLILPDKRVSAALEMPVFIKREEFRDRDDKKARDSVIILNSVTSSCYLINAKASRSDTRFFRAHPEKDPSGTGATQTTEANYPTCQNDLPRPATKDTT